MIVSKIHVILLSATLLAACAPSPESARGFRLPDGDSGAGQATFVALQCHGCHEIAGVGMPEFLGTTPVPVKVRLGGEVTRVKTYGELVTSIINPSHKLIEGYPKEQISQQGESLMRVYNDWMTVQQLIDLVAFLQSHYEVVPPDYEYYRFVY